MAWNTQRGMPGAMYVPRKFWTNGNEHHTLLLPVFHCFLGRNRDGQRRQVGYVKAFEDAHGPGVIALTMRMCKCIKGTGRVVSTGQRILRVDDHRRSQPVWAARHGLHKEASALAKVL